MITCPHCGQEFSEIYKEKAPPPAFGRADSDEQAPTSAGRFTDRKDASVTLRMQ